MGATGTSETGPFGRAPEEWAADLERALAGRDHEVMRRLLRDLRSELGGEVDALDRFERGHAVERLVEQVRRLLRASPTERERLEDELGTERSLWATYRRRYRETFVPDALRPFLDGCAAMLSPRTDGVQFAGAAKYAGTSRGAEAEAVTLFAAEDGVVPEADARPTPANFFTSYRRGDGRFVVRRAYRTFLPRGAGRAVLAEQMKWLVGDGSAPRELVFDNVQNRATYEAHVRRDGEARTLRPGVGAEETPLGRLGLRLLAPYGVVGVEARPVLDGFGFMDLRLVSRR